MRKSLSIVILLILPIIGWSQLETSADWKRQIYEKEYTFGIVGHTMGYAFNYRGLTFKDGYNKHGYEIEFVKLRHPKEVKYTPDRSSGNARSFVYDRTNSFFTLRGGYIREHILFDKTDRGTVSISLITSGGLSLGLSKPIYVVVDDESSTTVSGKVNERYNHDEHLASGIYGESGFLVGMWHTKLIPGAYLKVATNFDYNLTEKKVSAMEVGVVYDFFYKRVPIFYEDPNGENINLQGFFQVYMAFNFGFRKN